MRVAKADHRWHVLALAALLMGMLLVPSSLADNPFSGLGGKLLGGHPKPAESQPAAPPTTSTNTPEPVRPSTSQPAGPSAIAPATAPATEPANTAAPSAPTTIPAASRAPAADAPRISAHQNRVSAGIAGVGLTPEQVDSAIERGRDFLWAHLRDQLEKEHRHLGEDQGYDVLQALALVHAGAHLKYPEFDSELRGFLTRLDPLNSNFGTYAQGITCMLIGDYADPVFLPKMRLIARYLVEEQTPDGSWDYGTRVPPGLVLDSHEGPALAVEGGIPLDQPGYSAPVIQRTLTWAKRDPGDNSTSQFALLGLRAAARTQLNAPPETWQRSLRAYRARRCSDGGWGYEARDLNSYGSMTCAGLCAVAINRYQLGEKDPAADPDIELGLGWLDQHFSVTTNPQHGGYLYYHLYSLERVGRILDTEFIGSHEWYPLGARFLVGAQGKDGSWLESLDPDPRCSTSFALLFLTRATQSLKVELKRGGQGQVTTGVATPPPARLYVILDASGSMLDDMAGRQKFDFARDAVATILAGLPDSAEVSLRVYGHRKRSLEQGSDEDTELVFPMGKIDRPKLQSILQKLRPRGKTPLALSLQQAKQDLSSISGQPVTLVLLTDGGEDTMPRRDPVKAAADLRTIPNLAFHILGFDINQDDWSRQLHAMADAGGAHYWTAARAGMLAKELRSAVFGIPADFTLFDDSHKPVATGEFGQARTLPEGKYRFQTEFAGKPYSTDLWINTGSSTGVYFDATKLDHSSTPSGATTQPATATQSPPPDSQPHFCTHCGHPLPPNAKFCPSCGQPVKKETGPVR